MASGSIRGLAGERSMCLRVAKIRGIQIMILDMNVGLDLGDI